jgi:2-polyprenyl-6-methoxyphenol hydroxylase-like FAD-dependent oxidoreductase
VNAAARKDGDGKATYLSGVRVNYIKDLGDIVEVIHDGGVLLADFVIGADGSSSRVRKLLLPKSERKYTGYVAFRGTVKESELSEPTNQLFGENLTVYHRKAIQALVYVNLASLDDQELTSTDTGFRVQMGL